MMKFVFVLGIAFAIGIPATVATSDPKPALTIATQIEQGKKLYIAKCASCHGDAGQVAFDLTANGIKLDKPLDAATAAKIVLHP